MSEFLGAISSTCGIITFFGFVGGLFPRHQMQSAKTQLIETKERLDKELEAGRFEAMEGQCWCKRHKELEREFQTLETTFSKNPLTEVMPIFGPWGSYCAIWSLARNTRKMHQDLTIRLLELTETTSQEAYGSQGVPADTPPRVACGSYHDTSEDPGGGEEMASRLSRLAFTYDYFACIFSLIELTRKAREALHQNPGSSRKCQALLLELDSFSRLLHSVHDLLASRQDSTDPVSPSVVQAIQYALDSSRVTIGEFYASIEGYRMSYGEGGVGSMIWEPWRKLEWALFKGDKVTETRMKLQNDVERINALMSASQWAAIDRLETICKTQQVTLAQISRQMEQLPTELGYTWEGGIDRSNRPILLTDMLGQTIRLPIEICINSKVFDGFLKFYFSGRPGKSFIDRGHYALTTESNDLSALVLIQSANWESTVRPGSSVEMTAVVRRTVENKEPHQCPRCGRSQVTHISKTGNKCSYCGTWFTISEYATDRSVEQGPAGQVIRHADYLDTTSGSRQMLTSSEKAQCEELQYLRRIHVMEQCPGPERVSDIHATHLVRHTASSESEEGPSVVPLNNIPPHDLNASHVRITDMRASGSSQQSADIAGSQQEAPTLLPMYINAPSHFANVPSITDASYPLILTNISFCNIMLQPRVGACCTFNNLNATISDSEQGGCVSRRTNSYSETGIKFDDRQLMVPMIYIHILCLSRTPRSSI